MQHEGNHTSVLRRSVMMALLRSYPTISPRSPVVLSSPDSMKRLEATVVVIWRFIKNIELNCVKFHLLQYLSGSALCAWGFHGWGLKKVADTTPLPL